MKISKEKIKEFTFQNRIFILWIIAGIIIYSIAAGLFSYFSVNHSQSFSSDALSERSLGITWDDDNFTIDNDDAEFTIYNINEEKTDHIIFNISSITAPYGKADYIKAVVYAGIESGDDRSGEQGHSFILKKGVNDITVNESDKYLIVFHEKSENSYGNSPEILSGTEVGFKKISLSPSGSLGARLGVSFILFFIVWILIYKAGCLMGMKYRGLRQGTAMIAEGTFALVMILILAYGMSIWDNPFIIAVISCIVLFILFRSKGSSRISSLFEKAADDPYIPWILLLVMIIIMSITGKQMISYLPSDLGQIYDSACEIIENGYVNKEVTGEERCYWATQSSHNDYFLIYPNNIPVLVYITLFLKFIALFGVEAATLKANYCCIILASLSIAVSIAAGMKSASYIAGNKGRLAFILMSFLFFPYYMNTSIFYTDVLSMPFVSLAVMFYIKPAKKSRILKFIAVSLFLSAAYLIKGSAVIIVLAMIIHMIFKNIKNIRFAAALLAGFMVFNVSWNICQSNLKWIDYTQSEEYEFPVTHWIMMSLNPKGDGGYDISDYNYTASFPSKEEKNEADKKEISKRLASFDSIGDFISFEIKKSAVTWDDGQFIQNVHKYDGIYMENKIYEWILTSGKYYPLYYTYVTVYIVVIYSLSAAGALKSMKKKDRGYGSFLRLAMFGTILFFMMWESKSRYLFNMAPVFMLAALPGMNEKLSEKDRNFFEKTIDNQKKMVYNNNKSD